jgi:hypothetical protein
LIVHRSRRAAIYRAEIAAHEAEIAYLADPSPVRALVRLMALRALYQAMEDR